MPFRLQVPFAMVVLVIGGVPARGQDAPSLKDFLHVLKPRCIGPANMSGRIVEVAVHERRPSIMYVASASGGLWRTKNQGTTWDPVFERENTVALGAVAVYHGNPDTVWVGTGEANARNSVSWGDGVYKSTDGGKTWVHMGLKDTHHIGRIVIHPRRPEVVYVAALGHLWGPNRERGLYKTEDGGRSWKKVLFINEDTGFVDLAMDPSNPNVLYAAAYQVRRDAFSGGNPAVQYGPGGGLYKTINGGKSWHKLTRGLPHNALGRCGLSIYARDSRIVYAVVQTEKTRTTVSGQEANLKERSEKNEEGAIVKRPITADDGGIFRSDDGGETWVHVNSLCPRPFYYGQVRVDPNDDQRLYVLGIQMHLSTNGGKTFRRAPTRNVHSDHHALWIDPADSHHLVLGNDGGLYFSFDRGENWEHLLNLPVGQFYAVGADMRKPYRIYGGLQDNGSWGGPSATFDTAGITVADWFRILAMDGYYCQVQPGDDDIVFAEGQYGVLHRINVRTGENKLIKPMSGEEPARTPKKGKFKGKKSKAPEGNIVPPPPRGTPAYRFNWSAPILVSRHPPYALYYGGNFVFRSMDRGEHWTIISADLTRGEPGPSANTGHTITTLAESPLQPGLLWAGTDDGKIHVTRDGGKHWTDLSGRIPLPPERWISRIEASRLSEGTAYVSIDRHRNDDRAPYLFKTSDYGATWKALGGLPAGGPVHVVREDARRPELLYVGTEFGLFLSCDGGRTWHKQGHLPTVPVHDLFVHPRERELIIGTHGRSIWIMDVAPLQEMGSPAAVRLFDIKPVTAPRMRSLYSLGSKHFAGQNPPRGATIYYWLGEKAMAAPQLIIRNVRGTKIADLKGRQDAGLHALNWNMPAETAAGEYTATLLVGEQKSDRKFTIEPAP
jgi:photosystem II stability/assembly factor-like uncharacterized protein